MIRCVTGKPGDGKGLRLVGRMLDVLTQTDKVYVVTNENLLLDKVHEHVAADRAKRAEREGDDALAVVDLDKRLRVIPKNETFEYWRFRSGGLELDHSPDWAGGDDGARRIQKREFDDWMLAQFAKLKEREEYQWPVYYFISEAHEYFPAREWQRVGRGVLYHATKHRHLWDEMWLETQTPEQMDKAMCRLVSESEVCRNNLRRNIGLFRARPVFRIRSYYGLPNPNAAPFETASIDGTQAFKTAGECYKTTGAFGVHSKPEKVLNRGKLPWWALWVAAGGGMLLLVGLCFAGPQLLIRGVGNAIADSAKVPQAAAKPQSKGEQAMQYLGAPVKAEPVPSPARSADLAPIVDMTPRVVGLVRGAMGTYALLEDGSRCYSEDGLEAVRPGEVRILGRWRPIEPRPVSENERQAKADRDRQAHELAVARAQGAEASRRQMVADAQTAVTAAEQERQAWSAQAPQGIDTTFSLGSLPASSSSITSSASGYVIPASKAQAMGLPMVRTN